MWDAIYTDVLLAKADQILGAISTLDLRFPPEEPSAGNVSVVRRVPETKNHMSRPGSSKWELAGVFGNLTRGREEDSKE